MEDKGLNSDNDDEIGTNKEYANRILSRVKSRKKTVLLLKCMLNCRAKISNFNKYSSNRNYTSKYWTNSQSC